MGVFAWFRRKGEEPAAASADGTATAPVTADTDTAAQTAAESEAAAEVTEAAETTGAAPAPEAAGGEGVEIPKQQSAEEAADNGAGEGARK